jgi:N-methylhydantoinase B
MDDLEAGIDVTIDPIMLELMNNSLSSITDEMMITTHRTSYSGSIKYLMDFSAALFNARGDVIAQGVGMPHHLGALPGTFLALNKKFGANLHPGDIIAVNDPYEGGTHLPDLYIFKPIFHAGRCIAYAVLMAHHIDMGGRTPGSMAADNTSIHQEGLRIPPVKLYDRGIANDAVFDMIGKNVRIPDKVFGDIRAQVAACVIGERGVLALVQRYGLETLERYWDALLDYTERMMLAVIAEMTPGVYRFEDYVDDDGMGGPPVKIAVRLEVGKSTLAVDFAGTSKQAKGAINSTISYTVSCVQSVLRCLLPPQVPNNAGAYRPVRVTAPPGTVVNPDYPAAVAARGVTANRIDDAIFGALSKVLPHRIPAASDGGNTSIRMAGVDDTGRQYILMEVVNGSRGGRPNKDGIEGTNNPNLNLSNTPVEALESDFPVRVVQYGFVADTGGAGKYRGGLSIVREWQYLTDAMLQVRADRRLYLPWGTNGGNSGTPSENLLNFGTDKPELLPSKFVRDVHKGDRFRHITPGSGGYGDPLERDVDNVAKDVINQKLTREYAQSIYGVWLDASGERVDAEATRLARQALRSARDKKFKKEQQGKQAAPA